MFNLHDSSVVLTFLFRLVLSQNCLDGGILLALVVWIGHSNIEVRVLAVSPESTRTHIQSSSFVEVGGFGVAIFVCHWLKHRLCFDVVGDNFQQVEFSVADTVVSSVYESPEMAIHGMCDVERFATRTFCWQILYCFVVPEC